MNASISPDAPERLAWLEEQVAQVVETEPFSMLTAEQRKRLISLVAKRLKRAKRVNGAIVTADLYLLRHQIPELFCSGSVAVRGDV
ncbi:MAG: hypothetical protein HQL66_07035 [Magnetococcales bacterium]|nr:hypothetical protein [Magnetococcales bacterium]